MNKMNSYNVYISIFIYGVETLNIYIFVSVDIYNTTHTDTP